MKKSVITKALMSSSAICSLFGSMAFAQEATTQNEPAAETVVVVGSRIQGARTTSALPVVVLDEEQIRASGASSGDELMRSIPQMGDVLFEAANNPQTSNSARGDVNSVNLRSLGVGNTLVLLNGRRLVQHPTSQGTSDTGLVPVQSFNSNSVPVSGLQRLEVLLDGAAAIYGSDAVAGVVNTVLKSKYDGLNVQLQTGAAESTSMREYEGNVYGGKNFSRGNISVFLNASRRTALKTSDQDFTQSDDMRPFFIDRPGFNTSTVPDARAANNPWGAFTLPTGTPTIRQGALILSASGAFHYEPASLGCAGVNVGNNVCLVRGAAANNTTNRLQRFDTRYGTTVRPEVDRLNSYVTGHFDITDNLTAFGEMGLYQAKSVAIQPAVVNLNAIWIPASNYYNPFGPVTFANGQANPNRIPGLTAGVPTTGLAIRMGNYRFVDAGYQKVTVENFQNRFVAGLKGNWQGFNWETAFVYSTAEAEDVSPNINRTKLQAQLALSTPDAYNPFGGGCATTPSFNDCVVSSPTAINNIVFDLKRFSRTTLSMADFRVNKKDLLKLPAGDLGIAFGIEARRETQYDNRDANLDGTNTFTDSVSGEFSLTNVVAVSPNPDTKGARNVSGAYLELAVPLVSESMNIPLVQAFDVQLAARYENYSDFGSVTKPKIAASWDVFDGLRIRGSYSEGFRAPNLEQTNATQYARAASVVDYVRCEADLRAARITSFNSCTGTTGVSLLIAGNPDLKPEESVNQSVGFVYRPAFLPESLGRFTFTFDQWRIEQTDIVGLLGAQSSTTLDYLNRVSGGSNPNVIRAAVAPTDTTQFAGTGLAAAGVITAVQDRFVNLLPQTVTGLDIGFNWTKKRTRFGSFTLDVNATQLKEFGRSPGPIVDSLYAARAASTINSLTPLPDSTQLIARNGRPEWKGRASLVWNKGSWRSGISMQYTSEVEQTGFLSTSGQAWVIEDQLLTNLYVQHDFKNIGGVKDVKVRIGARDLFSVGPPLAVDGYLGSLHNPYSRYVYMNITKSF